MSVTVTLHVFSGRPDPAWELSDQQAQELAARLASISKTTLLKPPGVLGALGYRGFTIQAVRERDFEPETYVHAGIVDTSRYALNLSTGNADLERWLLSTGGTAIEPDVEQYVSNELSGGRMAAFSGAPTILTVPPYNSAKWNNDSNVRIRNNCYNYANDKITNTFAQPGKGSGRSWSVLLSCANDVAPAAQRDGQVPIQDPFSTPAQGHHVALVLAVGYDYHWYRLDSNFMWSHKPGQTAARNTDNSGRTISDPRNCDRGPYQVFCGFYHCIPANTRIA